MTTSFLQLLVFCVGEALPAAIRAWLGSGVGAQFDKMNLLGEEAVHLEGCCLEICNSS